MNAAQTKDDLLAEGRALKQQVKDMQRMLDEAGDAAQKAEERAQAAEAKATEVVAKDDAAPYRRGCPKDHGMPQQGAVFVVQGFVFCSRGHFRVYGQRVFTKPVAEPAEGTEG